jgi:DNA-binding NarL/FixJ family response regulator
MIRLLIADDHQGVRHGLRAMFGATPDISVVAECTDGDEVADAARNHSPHVALLDVGMPRVGGFEAARRLLALCPGTRVLFLSGLGSAPLLDEARALGAAGFALKGDDPCELADHVRRVASGGSAWVCRA